MTNLQIAYPFHCRCRIARSFSSAHRALDIIALDDRRIYSPVGGVIVKSNIIEKPNEGWQHGNYIIIRTENGIDLHFKHLLKRFAAEGQAVKENELIGIMGKSGQCAAPHLHLEAADKNGNSLKIAEHSEKIIIYRQNI